MKTNICFLLIHTKTDQNTSCRKELEIVVTNRSVFFIINKLYPLIIKMDNKECRRYPKGNFLIPTIAKEIITSVTYRPRVYFFGDKFYTQSIEHDRAELNKAFYNVAYFDLFDLIGGTLVMTIPEKCSCNGVYVEKMSTLIILLVLHQRQKLLFRHYFEKQSYQPILYLTMLFRIQLNLKIGFHHKHQFLFLKPKK